jgi:hypothetical protein
LPLKTSKYLNFLIDFSEIKNYEDDFTKLYLCKTNTTIKSSPHWVSSSILKKSDFSLMITTSRLSPNSNINTYTRQLVLNPFVLKTESIGVNFETSRIDPNFTDVLNVPNLKLALAANLSSEIQLNNDVLSRLAIINDISKLEPCNDNEFKEAVKLIKKYILDSKI